MRPALRYGVIALLVVGALAILASTQSGPLLYSLEKDRFPSPYHVNTNALKAQELNSTTGVLPLMQDLLDYSGPVVLNIRAGDIDSARRDLEAYAKTRRSFDNLVLKLDMTESEIKEFSKSQANQEKILADLLNSSVALDQLASLEVQYRNENNPTMLSTIRLQGDALRTKITTLADQYDAEAQASVTIGKKTGLDTSSEEESDRNFREYAEEIRTAGHRQQQVDIPIRRSSQLSLLLYPDSGTYGETIRGFGYYFSQYGYRIASTPDKPVTLYLDDKAIGNITTDETGSYAIDFPVDAITSGKHLVHAASGTTRSDQRILTVIPADSVTTLAVTLSKVPGQVTCSGTVMATIPVRHAPVELVIDGSSVNLTRTGSKGEYKQILNLSAGVHTVQARFTGTGYPLTPSESAVQTIVIPPAALPFDYRIAASGAILLLLALVVAGAVAYARRGPKGARHPATTVEDTDRQGRDDTGDGTWPDLAGPALAGGEDAVPEGSIPERYAQALSSRGLVEATHAMYSEIAERLARDHKIARHLVLTPREMAKTCRQRPYCGPFSRLVAAYEHIRYGGCDTGPLREEFEASLELTDARMRGDDH